MPLVIVWIALFFSFSALAQTSQADQDAAQGVFDRHQHHLKNQHHSLERKRKRSEHQRRVAADGLPAAEEAKDIPGITASCMPVEQIVFREATLLGEKDAATLSAPYLHHCVTIADINRLMKAVSQHYIDAGYTTTRTALPEQNASSGVLEILVIEGRIEELKLNDNSLRDRMQLAAAFPTEAGRVLNIHDLEQGLDQLNRLASNHATMQIVPGSQEGHSKVIITNEPHHTNHATARYDNAGQTSVGRHHAMVGLSHDNLIGLGDAWNFMFADDTDAHNAERGSNTLVGAVTLPFGYWNASLSRARSGYLLTSVQGGNASRFTGSSTLVTAKLERTLARSATSKTSAYSGLCSKDTRLFLYGAPIASATRTLNVWDIGMDHSMELLGGSALFNASYARGLDRFGAKEDSPTLTSRDPHAQFDKWMFDAHWERPFTLEDLQFAYRAVLVGQYSPDHLFASERIGMGDRNSVRGFGKHAIAGDTGGYLRNELAWDIPTDTQHPYVHSLVGNVEPYVALDAGMARTRGGKFSEGSAGEQAISGWAVGVRNHAEWLNVDLAYADAIKTPGSFLPQDREMYLMVSTQVGF